MFKEFTYALLQDRDKVRQLHSEANQKLDTSGQTTSNFIVSHSEYINNINNIIKKNSIEGEDDLHRCIKKINNYVRDNSDINEIDTKVLNGEISLKGYVFCKKGGQQQMLKKQYIPMSRSETKPLLYRYVY